MKYYVFGSLAYEALGGLDDLKGVYDTLDEAVASVTKEFRAPKETRMAWDSIQIATIINGKICEVQRYDEPISTSKVAQWEIFDPPRPIEDS